MQRSKRNKAFSLIEIVITLTIIGILVMLGSPKFLDYVEQAKLTQVKANVKTVEDVVLIAETEDTITNKRYDFLTGKELASDKLIFKDSESFDGNSISKITNGDKLRLSARSLENSSNGFIQIDKKFVEENTTLKKNTDRYYFNPKLNIVGYYGESAIADEEEPNKEVERIKVINTVYTINPAGSFTNYNSIKNKQLSNGDSVNTSEKLIHIRKIENNDKEPIRISIEDLTNDNQVLINKALNLNKVEGKVKLLINDVDNTDKVQFGKKAGIIPVIDTSHIYTDIITLEPNDTMELMYIVNLSKNSTETNRSTKNTFSYKLYDLEDNVVEEKEVDVPAINLTNNNLIEVNLKYIRRDVATGRTEEVSRGVTKLVDSIEGMYSEAKMPIGTYKYKKTEVYERNKKTGIDSKLINNDHFDEYPELFGEKILNNGELLNIGEDKEILVMHIYE